MKDFNFFKLFKRWLISIWIADLAVFVYLMISGRVLNDFSGTDIILPLGIIGAVLSGIVGVWSIVYAIIKKEYSYIAVGIGVAFGGLILYLWMMIIALAGIF